MMIDRKKSRVVLLLGLILLMSSCTTESNILGDKEPASGKQGTVTLNLSSTAGFEAQTRAVNENDYRNLNNYTVQLLKSSGEKIDEFSYSAKDYKLPYTLDLGSYIMKAFYGQEKDASRDVFYSVGQTVFTVKADQTEAVSVVCEPTCGKISAVFDNAMATYFDEYKVTYSGTEALGAKTLDWLASDTAPWYVKLNATGETMHYAIYLRAKDDYLTNVDGNKLTEKTIEGNFVLKRNTAHKLTIAPTYTPTGTGGLGIQITIDESTNDQDITLDVPISWVSE